VATPGSAAATAGGGNGEAPHTLRG
jgi:hypothetical protein